MKGSPSHEQIQMILAETIATLNMHIIFRCGSFKNIVAFSNAMSYKLGYIVMVHIHSSAEHITIFVLFL